MGLKTKDLITDAVALGFEARTTWTYNWQFDHEQIPEGTMVEYQWLCEVVKWLRDDKKYYVETETSPAGIYVNIHDKKGVMIKTFGADGGYPTHEDALVVGVSETLKLIKDSYWD